MSREAWLWDERAMNYDTVSVESAVLGFMF